MNVKILKGITARKVGIALLLLFVLGLSTATIYSRSYAERQKPLVHVVFPESGDLFWSFQARGTVVPASEELASLGAAHVIEILVPRSAFRTIWASYLR